MKNSFNKGSHSFRELAVGDSVCIQNQTTLRKIRWDRMGIITGILHHRQYKIIMDGSHHLTVRNRRHLRKIEVPKPEPEEVKLEEEDDEEEE